MINKRPVLPSNAQDAEPEDVQKELTVSDNLPTESSATDSMRRENDPRTGFREPPPSIPYNPPPMSENAGLIEDDTPQEIACDTSFFDKMQRVLMPLLLLAIALLGCSITKNIAVFYQSMRTMAVWEIVLFSIPMVLFTGILLFVLCKFIILMHHLRTFTQISAKALQELRGRENLRRLCVQREEEAREKLTELLKTDSPEQDKFFQSFGEEKLLEIRKAKESLLETHCTAGEWISKYVSEYQNKIDELAQNSSAAIHGKRPLRPPHRHSLPWINSLYWPHASPC